MVYYILLRSIMVYNGLLQPITVLLHTIMTLLQSIAVLIQSITVLLRSVTTYYGLLPRIMTYYAPDPIL